MLLVRLATMRRVRVECQRRIRPRLTALIPLLAVVLVAACGTKATLSSTSPAGSAAATPGPLTFVSAWQHPPAAPTWVESFGFAGPDTQTGYACLMTALGPSSTARMVKSTDGGRTWAALTHEPVTANYCQVFADPSDQNDLLVESIKTDTVHQKRIPAAWRTRDGGVTWTTV